MTRKELQTLSRIRLREARALARLGMSDGAYYLAGYSIECALKACIAKLTQRHEFPNKERAIDGYGHRFGKLLEVAGLEQLLLRETRIDPAFLRNWDIVRLWKPDSRYTVSDAAITREFIEALEDRRHGILPWIKRHW